MTTKIILLIGVVFSSCIIKDADADFYYRPYNGTIPHDAVLAGNENGVDYFIGTGVTHGKENAWDIFGEFPGRLQSGSTGIEVSISGSVIIGDGLRVLCSSSTTNPLMWIPVTHDRFYDDLGDKLPVYGGVEGSAKRDYRSRLFIGRVGNNIGKVTANDINLYIVDNSGTQEQFQEFEVLAY